MSLFTDSDTKAQAKAKLNARTSQYVVYASGTCALDSTLASGGGTNDTTALQALLDAVESAGGGEVVLDGVAKVTGLQIGANTHFRGLGWGTGLYLASGSNVAAVKNKGAVTTTRTNNVRVSDMAINANGANQTQREDNDSAKDLTHGMMFKYVGNLGLRNLRLFDTKCFGILIGDYTGGFVCERVTSTHASQAALQDTVHVAGPGVGLFYISDISGDGHDDCVAINIDEVYNISGTVDTWGAIDGGTIERVFCNGCNQGVRLLSQVFRMGPIFVRDITGTVGSYAVHAGPTFSEGPGNFASIVIDGVDVKLRGAGNHYSNNNTDTVPYWNVLNFDGQIDNVSISRLNVDQFGDNRPAVYLSPRANIRTLSIEQSGRTNDGDSGVFLQAEDATIGALLINGLRLKNVPALASTASSPAVGTMIATNVRSELGGAELIQLSGTNLLVSNYVGQAVLSGGTWTNSKVNGDVLIVTDVSLSNGQVAHWKFNDGSGASAANSGYSAALTLTGSPTWSGGLVGSGSLTFNGSNYGTNTTPPRASGANFNFSAWFKKSSAPGGNQVIYDCRKTAGDGGFVVYMTTAGKIELFKNAPGSDAAITSTTVCSDNANHLASCSYDGTTLKLFIDGAMEASAAYSFTGFTATSYPFVADAHNGGGRWVGILDEIRIHNRALSDAEQTALYNAGAGTEA